MRLDGEDRPTILWYEDDPTRLQLELEAVQAVAPALEWVTAFSADSPAVLLGSGGWIGRLPLWPFERPAPPGLSEWLENGLEVAIACSAAHPVAMPRIWPIYPEPTPEYRTRHAWHLNGDGTLCMFLRTTEWTGREFVSELVHKAAGWFLEYQLMLEDPEIEVMTSEGIASSAEFDERLTLLAQRDETP